MRPESVINTFFFISWLITLGYIIYWGKKPFFINSPSYKLPSLFLELSSDLRRLSLDLAWKLGLEQISSFPFSSVGKKLYSKLFFAASSILIFFKPSRSFDRRKSGLSSQFLSSKFGDSKSSVMKLSLFCLLLRAKEARHCRHQRMR